MEEASQNKLIDSILDDKLFLPWIINPSEESNKYWNAIMRDDPEKKKTINDLKIIIKGIKVNEDNLSIKAKKELWNKIENSPHFNKKKRFILLTFLRYAAVFLIVAGISTYIYVSRFSTNTIVDYSSFISEITDSVEHSNNNVLIVLGNQKKIELQEKNVELIHDTEGRMSVNMKVIESQLSTNVREESFNRIYVPYGKTTTLIMSDGSKIWVNSGSHIIYPTRFPKDRREIYVEGEAYLEVAKNDKSPFIVKTDLLEINVLGTSFNVSAYKNDPDRSVVLATGSISIKEVGGKEFTTMRPNQQYLLNKSSRKHHLKEVDVLDHICWKYGFLSFQNDRLSDVLKKIERYYNISIISDDSLTDHTTFSGKLDLKENIDETFRILSITAPIEYKIKKNEINIYVKP